MKEALAAPIFDDEDLENDWSWNVDWVADTHKRLKRLETGHFTRFELYEELMEIMCCLEVFWLGCSPKDQMRTARAARELLRKCEALKERMQNWAAKEIRRKMRETGRIPLREWDEVCKTERW